MLRWCYQWSVPAICYQRMSILGIVCGVLSILLLGVGLWSGLYWAPSDYQQQDAFRIIYVHVPCAWLSLTSYAIVVAGSLIYLVWHIKVFDILAVNSAKVGVWFTVLALLTGAIWGKPMWGTWWTWDARLTSELILLFLYLGYLGLRSAIEDPKLAACRAGFLAVIGGIDLPIVHYSVQWWETLHQGVSVSVFAKSQIASSMLYPLLLCGAGFYVFWFFIICFNCAANLLNDAKQDGAKWVHAIKQ